MTLSREASDRLTQYLTEMRASLADSTLVDVTEVEQDIRDHVDAELAESPSPISVDALNPVLHRLGSPRQWAGVEPARAADRSPADAFDDRLVYVSAGSMVLFMVFPPLLVLSWILARWTLARFEERARPLGALQWLLYPPILIVIAPMGVLGLFWTFAPFAELGGALFDQPRLLAAPARDVIGAAAVTLGGLGAYWMLLGPVLAFADRLVRLLFYPFAEGFGRRHGWWLAGTGTAVAAAAVSVLLFLGGR